MWPTAIKHTAALAFLTAHAISGLAYAVETSVSGNGFDERTITADQHRVESNTPERLVVVIDETYAMGDNDSRLDARRLTLESAKRRAAELAGTYIETDTRVSGNKISKDEIRTLSAAYLETRILAERYTLDASGKQQLVLSVHADLDKTIIHKRIESLLANTEYRGQIEQLHAENERLKDELDDLNQRIKTKQITQRYQVLQDRSAVLDKLDTTTASVRKVFEEGTLYLMARKSQTQLDAAKADIDANVFRYLEHNTKVTVGPPEIKPNPDGTADILVRITWDVDDKPLLSTLNRYFAVESTYDDDTQQRSPTGFWLKAYQNTTGKGKVTYSKELLEYVEAHAVMAKINAGGYITNRPIAATVSCFVGCAYQRRKERDDERDEERYDYMIRSHYAGHDDTVGSDQLKHETQNPVILSHIPESQLKTITSIEARVVVQ